MLLWSIAAKSADTVYYIHTDALGSPTVITDANRNVVERTQYAPYGQVLNRPEHDGPGYTGHEEDSQTGLTNMQARYDNKIVGRMISTDPVDVDPNTGANFNRYAYAADNPYKFTDPDGRQVISREEFMQSCEASALECGERWGQQNHIELAAGGQPSAKQTARPAGQCDETCDEFREHDAELVQEQHAAVHAASKEFAKQAGWMVLSDIGGRALGKLFGPVLRFLRVSDDAAKIASGHAFEKHIGEFSGLGIKTEHQFARHIDSIIANPTAERELSRGRTAFWDAESGTVVIRDPASPDGGTAFIPKQGIDYFNGLQ